MNNIESEGWLEKIEVTRSIAPIGLMWSLWAIKRGMDGWMEGGREGGREGGGRERG